MLLSKPFHLLEIRRFIYDPPDVTVLCTRTRSVNVSELPVRNVGPTTKGLCKEKTIPKIRD